MNKNNYILLGLAISYVLVTLIQIRIDGFLPASLYVTVAFVSLEITILEMFKNVGFYLLHGMDKWNETYIGFFGRSIKTYSRFNILNILDEDKKEYEDAIISLQNDRKINMKKEQKLLIQ